MSTHTIPMQEPTYVYTNVDIMAKKGKYGWGVTLLGLKPIILTEKLRN